MNKPATRTAANTPDPATAPPTPLAPATTPRPGGPNGDEGTGTPREPPVDLATGTRRSAAVRDDPDEPRRPDTDGPGTDHAGIPACRENRRPSPACARRLASETAPAPDTSRRNDPANTGRPKRPTTPARCDAANTGTTDDDPRPQTPRLTGEWACDPATAEPVDDVTAALALAREATSTGAAGTGDDEGSSSSESVITGSDGTTPPPTGRTGPGPPEPPGTGVFPGVPDCGRPGSRGPDGC